MKLIGKYGFSKFIIYGLCDPDTDEIRYVGQSKHGLSRPRYSMYMASCKSDSYKHRWIKSLASKGKQPSVIVLEELSSSGELDDAEVRAISKMLAAGARLTNATGGGQFGWEWTDDSYRKFIGKRSENEQRELETTSYERAARAGRTEEEIWRRDTVAYINSEIRNNTDAGLYFKSRRDAVAAALGMTFHMAAFRVKFENGNDKEVVFENVNYQEAIDDAA